MKRTLLVILGLVVIGGGVYALMSKTVSPETASVSPPHEPASSADREGMGEVVEPSASPQPETPAPTPVGPTPLPPPAPVPDKMEDVDPIIDAVELKVFNLTGKNFSFSQNEIRVKKGDRVKIDFESTDGFHDWVVDEFNARTAQVNTGGKTSVEFVADKAGTFEYYCSVGIHRQAGMKGSLVVE